MLKNIKLSWKIGLGFGLVLTLSAAVGVLAIFKIRSAQHDADELTAQDVPQVKVASDLMKNCLNTRFATRGYNLAEDKKYLEDARQYMKEAKDIAVRANQLVAGFPDLVRLRDGVQASSESSHRYEQLLDDTVKLIDQSVLDRKALDEAVQRFGDACRDYLAMMHEKMAKEIDEATGAKPEVASATQPAPSTVLVKSVTDTRPAGSSNGSTAVARSSPGTQPAASPDAAALAAKSPATQPAKTTGVTLATAMSNRQKKIQTANDLIDLGNRILCAVLRGRADRDPAVVERAMPQFATILAQIDELKAATTQAANLKQLDDARTAATSFKAAAEGLLATLKAKQGLTAQREEAAKQILAATESVLQAGMEEISVDTERADQNLGSATKSTSIGLVIATAIGVVLSLIIARGIVGPIRKGVQFAQVVASGDFTHRVDVQQKDEIGDLVASLNGMAENLQKVMQKITANAGTLASSSTELSATATQLASGAEETTAQSATVAAAAEEMSTNMGSMAAASEQMSANVKTVAAAVEEMTASIGEVARNAEQAASVAQNATQLAQASNDRIGQLDTAAAAIGKVIEVIQDIAEQTNLLALNATIEAARAGDAGKGFAVVATEVKELAKQTAEATEDIRKRIEAIQSSTGEAVQSIGQITEVIGKVNDVSRTIASAVEEQSITTKEIAQNVAQTASASTTVSQGVAQSATASHEITKNMTGVDSAAKQTAQGAAQTQQAGQELSKLAEGLQALVGQFKV